MCCTDSMVALYWVKGQSSRWKRFVANRVAEIQSTWDPECRRYCTSKENPADLLTRGLSCGDINASTLCWNRPRWLSSSDRPLPVQPQVGPVPSEVRDEERKIAHCCTAVVRELLIHMSRYGTWLKLIRVTAYVPRAVKLFTTKCKSSESELSGEEVKKAEMKCCKWVQEEVYKEDLPVAEVWTDTSQEQWPIQTRPVIGQKGSGYKSCCPTAVYWST